MMIFGSHKKKVLSFIIP